MATLDSLSPRARTQYEALMPEIERSARSASNARGMFYSGEATAAETRAKTDLLAKLAGQDAATEATASENERTRQLQEKLEGERIKAGKRQALLGLLGAGVGSAATIGGLSYMNKGAQAGANVIPLGNGKSITEIPTGGTVGGAMDSYAPLGSDDPLGSALGEYPGSAPGMDASLGAGKSMWKNATSLPSLGAGLAGGGLGYLGANAINGRNGPGGEIGSALGGLGAYGAYAKFGGGNPWLAGLSALGGSFGGGLLGNLFKI